MPTIIDGTDGVNKVDFSEIATGTPDATTFLRGDGEWAQAGSPPGTLELLQEDIFTTSGTWTKASGFDPDDTVFMLITGGGGSGGAVYVTTGNGAATGGASGNAVVTWGRYGDFPASLDLVAGAGGAAVSRTTVGTQVGNNGGTTIVSSGGVTLVSEGGGPRGEAATAAVSGASGSIAGINVLSTQGQYAGRYFNFSETSSATDPAGNLVPGPGFIRSLAGGAARQGATDRAQYNAVFSRPFTISGAGSGTANGQDATGIGGGGGGCVRQNATAVSGAGGNGGILVRYYRGAVPILAILNGA